MKNWQIVTIPTEDGNDTLSGALGISKKRVKELKQITEAADKHFKTISDALEAITGQCQNINEAIFIAFMYGDNKCKCRSCPGAEMSDNMPEDLKSMIDELAKRIGGNFGGIIEIKRRRDEDE